MKESIDYEIRWKEFEDPFEAVIREKESNGFDNDHSSIPIFHGPMGPIPITEGGLASRRFKFWMGFTNFRVARRKIIDIIDNVDGVESFDIETPYRFRISVAQLFDDNSVKKLVEDNVFDFLKKESAKTSKNEKLTNLLKSQYKYWAVLHRSEKKPIILHSDNQDELEEKVENIKMEQNINHVEYSWNTQT